MIYILNDYDPLYEHEWIASVFEVNDNIDAKELYSKFLLNKAEELGIVINPHYY